MALKPIGITVLPGVQVTITIPQVFLKKGKTFCMDFCLTEAQVQEYAHIIGTEVVYIQNGIGGENYQLLDYAADIFYGGKLLLGRCYVIRFGNNGLPSSVKHFININTPCCSRAYDPANGDIGAIRTASTGV